MAMETDGVVRRSSAEGREREREPRRGEVFASRGMTKVM